MKSTHTLITVRLLTPLAVLGSASVPMPTVPDNHDSHDSHDWARRIRERLR